MSETNLGITVGTVLVDLDPRTKGKRFITVTAVTRKHIEYQAGVRKAKVSIDRVYPAGSTKKSGYSIVSGGATLAEYEAA